MKDIACIICCRRVIRVVIYNYGFAFSWSWLCPSSHLWSYEATKLSAFSCKLHCLLLLLLLPTYSDILLLLSYYYYYFLVFIIIIIIIISVSDSDVIRIIYSLLEHYFATGRAVAYLGSLAYIFTYRHKFL